MPGERLDSDQVLLPISLAAAQTGLSEDTLRIWQRRYGLGASRRSAGGHRRYTAQDLDRLRRALRLVEDGVPAGEAARTVLFDPGRQLDLPDGTDTVVRRLASAAVALDGPAVAGQLGEHLSRYGVVHTWDAILRPVLAAVGDQWQDFAHGVAIEHLLSHLATVAFGSMGRPVDPEAVDPDRPRVLMACVPEEQHDLPLRVLAAGLMERGVGATVLGACTPTGALTEAATRLAPLVTVLHAHEREFARTSIPRTWRHPAPLIASGPGWSPAHLPEAISHVNDVAGALDVICDIV